MSAEINESPSAGKPAGGVAAKESNPAFDDLLSPGAGVRRPDGAPDAELDSRPRRQPIRLFSPRRTDIYFLRR